MKKFIAFGLICSALISVDALSARAPVQRNSAATSATKQTGARAAVRNTPTSSQATTSAKNVPVPSSGTKAPVASKNGGGVSARAATTQKAINSGTKIAGATTNTVVSEECKTKYYGCMDSFCMLDNTNGGRCLCSDKNAELDNILAQIQKLDEQSYALATTGVERINMGESADAVMQKVDEITKSMASNDNVPSTSTQTKKKARTLDLSAWDNTDFDDDLDVFADATKQDSTVDLSNKTGDALHTAVQDVCGKQIPECAQSISMLKMMYAQQIKSDCGAYENSLKQQRNASAKKLQTAQTALREAALEQHQNANKYDLGQCTVRFKQCMQTTAGCGDDFSKCAAVVADSSTTATTTRGRSARGAVAAKQYTIKGTMSNVTIAAETYDIISSKQPMCESVLKECVSVKDKVWDTFLREVAPTLKTAELLAESNLRMNCIGNLSDCFQKACKDNMDPNDPEGSYDMCLSRPDTMHAACKVQLEPCEKANPQIFDFVKARLASMRVDACTKEVKNCLQDENRCGEDYSQCMGLDLSAIYEMCPTDKLTACNTDPETGRSLPSDEVFSKISNIIYGLTLNIDNAFLTGCQNQVNAKFAEVCGEDSALCGAFDGDADIGAKSLRSYKNSNGDTIIGGLIRFDKLPIDKNENGETFGSYKIDVAKYLSEMDVTDPNDEDYKRVQATLTNLQNKINQKINLIANDPKIAMCLKGRDMKQIRGNRTKTKKNADGTDVVDENGNVVTESDNQTEGRFPHLMDDKMDMIVEAALEKAQDNYGKEYDKMFKEATEGMDNKVKQALCASIANKPDLTCLSRNSNKICTKYAVTSMSNAFKNYDESTGNSTTNSLRETFSGTSMKKLLTEQLEGTTAYQQRTKGNWISKSRSLGNVIVSSNYDESAKACKLTVQTTACTGFWASILSYVSGVTLEKDNPDAVRKMYCSGAQGSTSVKTFEF
ncbi:MAG: hypothetical protein IKP24_00545 [Alphaproteobacteria bacterium]|nr:hypothetical protein [Alphaproteobacteria bacterium]